MRLIDIKNTYYKTSNNIISRVVYHLISSHFCLSVDN
nr:MAG TPA: hypothetical protein [Caudoviricetes sp.]